MSADVKITILGTSGSGKTCYMLGMYSVMQLGINGFTLRAKDMDEDIRLTRLWDALAEVEGPDRWPPPTVKVSDTNSSLLRYKFDFNYGFTPLKGFNGFEWVDYRGDALSYEGSDELNSDVRELREQMKTSDSVMICISGEHLTKPITSKAEHDAVARKVRINMINSYLTLLAQVREISESRPFPVVIVITKYDLVVAAGRDEDEEKRREVISDIKKLFATLFIQESGWLTMLCPVSLGKELANNRDGGTIDPINVHLPLAFAVYGQMRDSLIIQRNSVRDLEAVIDSVKRRNFFERIIRPVNTDVQEKELGRNRQAQDALRRDMRLLAKELENAQLFLSGNEIQVDV